MMVVHRKGKDASTGFEVIENFGKYSLFKFDLFTGRTHQIRVHMKETGHPFYAIHYMEMVNLFLSLLLKEIINLEN